ncbi:YfhO family protein [candidate division KSB3 bacterium]|uniref:YfhO family protein n=1 Tax=candidate division KSB3 bacterium TaxID=2044937 RepID=A0A9D5Q814_9BACT|nr:YfhO family protein [candidate division KSB3 bacterium]MBD3327495.1 YfhO family protein [candidate division KSB3 bacterium]
MISESISKKMPRYNLQALQTFVAKRPTLCALSGLLLIGAIFFAQLLFSGEIINATDILTQQYFWNVFIKENLFVDPCFRTWLPYVNAGTPFSGGLNLLFRPISLLTLLLLPVHVAISYEIVLHLLLMGVGMYFYMRELRVSHLSAFFAALFLMLNGEIVTLINAGHVNKIGAIFPITLVFFTLERALRRKTLWAFLLVGAALGFQFWQGHVQISYYTCIAVGLYLFIRFSIIYYHTRNQVQVSFLLLFAVVMVVVFLLLSAVEFLPLLSFATVSERAEGVSYEFATSWSMPPEELITYVIPGFFGFRRPNYYDDEEIVTYWGRMPFTQTGRYFGLLPLLFMLLAICFVRNRHVLTLSIIALIALILGMGKYIPIYKFLYEYVPGFNMFRVPQMILFLFAFATSALAGFGAQWLFGNFSQRKERRLRLFVLAGIAIFLLAWLITIALPQVEQAILALFHQAFFRKGATQEIAAARFDNIFRGFLLFNVLFGLALVVLSLRLVKPLRLPWIVVAMLSLYLLDIGLFNSHYLDTIPLENSHYVDENDAIRYFKAHPGLYRILQATNTPVSYATANKYLYYHLFNVSGYEAVGVEYYNTYLENMALGTPLVDLLNIKYLILPKDAQVNDQELEVGDIIGPYKVVLTTEVVLLENLNALPRAFPVHHVTVLTTPEEIFSTLLRQDFQPSKTVIIEEQLPSQWSRLLAEGTQIPSSQSTVEVTFYLNRTIRLRANMAEDGFVVLSEKYYPGWKAYVDGQETPIYKADYTLQSIFVPQGEHEITFLYQPTQFFWGLGITVSTLVVLLGVALYTRGTKRRRENRRMLKMDTM